MYYQLGNVLQLTVLSNSAPPQPPALLKAVFSTSGAKAFVYFDSATDEALVVPAISTATSAWPCSLLLTFKGVDDTSCNWLNNTVVQLEFSPTNSYLAVGSTVSLLPFRIKAVCSGGGSGGGAICSSYAFSKPSIVFALAPANPVYPTIVLTIPSIISRCDNLTVDPTSSSGSGGRLWTKVRWDVTSGGSVKFASYRLIFCTTFLIDSPGLVSF